MSIEKHLGIWMNATNAHFMEFTSTMIPSIFKSAVKHTEKVEAFGRSERIIVQEEAIETDEYYTSIIEKTKGYNSILLFGPSDEKLEILELIKKNNTQSTLKVVVKHGEIMTEIEELTFVNNHFTKKDKSEYKIYSMDTKNDVEKAKAHIVVALIEYIPNAVVSKTIIKKTTGNITATSFDIGEELGDKISPFDTYVQIIDGTAEVVINDKELQLKLGEGIIIPAHAKHSFNANEQFKMLTTVIKSGYEDLS